MRRARCECTGHTAGTPSLKGADCAAAVASQRPVAVEGAEAGEEEEGVVRLGLDVVAPVPGRGEPPVDAGSRVEEVVSPRTVERVSEKIREDVLSELVRASEWGRYPVAAASNESVY